MSDQEIHEFDVATGEQMQDLLPADRFDRLVLHPDRVPPELQDLIPLAERWGVSCDVTRHQVAELATDDELTTISNALRGRHDAIEDFLYSFDIGQYSDESACFQALLVFELEECDGPGIRGELEYRLRKYGEDPTLENRGRLLEAYNERLKIATAGRYLKHYEGVLREAELALGITPGA